MGRDRELRGFGIAASVASTLGQELKLDSSFLWGMLCEMGPSCQHWYCRPELLSLAAAVTADLFIANCCCLVLIWKSKAGWKISHVVKSTRELRYCVVLAVAVVASPTDLLTALLLLKPQRLWQSLGSRPLCLTWPPPAAFPALPNTPFLLFLELPWMRPLVLLFFFKWLGGGSASKHVREGKDGVTAKLWCWWMLKDSLMGVGFVGMGTGQETKKSKLTFRRTPR